MWLQQRMLQYVAYTLPPVLTPLTVSTSNRFTPLMATNVAITKRAQVAHETDHWYTACPQSTQSMSAATSNP